MAGTDSIREAIETLIAREKKLVEELTQVRISIRTLKRAAGIELTSEESETPEPTNVAIPEASFDPVASNAYGSKQVRPDEFFGMTHAEAARRYLKKVGHAVSFDELVDVLQKGGCKLSGADPKKVLYISLIRNSKDFVPPQPGFVGLRDFYPTRARGAAEQKAKKSKRGAKKPARSVSKPKVSSPKPAKKSAEGNGDAANTIQAPAAQPKLIPLAVHEFMNDKQFHQVDEIVNAVRKKLGENVPTVSIHGTLSSRKMFERNEQGMYRLVN